MRLCVTDGGQACLEDDVSISEPKAESLPLSFCLPPSISTRGHRPRELTWGCASLSGDVDVQSVNGAWLAGSQLSWHQKTCVQDPLCQGSQATGCISGSPKAEPPHLQKEGLGKSSSPNPNLQTVPLRWLSEKQLPRGTSALYF